MSFHMLGDIDPVLKIGVCSICGPTKVRFKGKRGKRICIAVDKAHRKKYRQTSAVYRAAEKARRKRREKARGLQGFRVSNNWKYRKHVKPVCEKCGYKALHPCLIDGHHRDGDRSNNHPDNIASLCAICHRIEHLPVEVKKSLGTTGIVKTTHGQSPTEGLQLAYDKLKLENEKLLAESVMIREEIASIGVRLGEFIDNPEGEGAILWKWKYDEIAKKLARYENDGS